MAQGIQHPENIRPSLKTGIDVRSLFEKLAHKVDRRKKNHLGNRKFRGHIGLPLLYNRAVFMRRRIPPGAFGLKIFIFLCIPGLVRVSLIVVLGPSSKLYRLKFVPNHTPDDISPRGTSQFCQCGGGSFP